MRRILLFALVMLVALATNSPAKMNVLVLAGNISRSEFAALENFDDVNGENVSYKQTPDRALPGLNNVDILWIGQGEICENAYFFDAATEDMIKSFVQSGGIAISMGQDSDGGRPCEAGWLPEPLVGVERGGTEVFNPTDAPETGDLFTSPNEVATAHFDDTWIGPDDPFIMLATINGSDVGFALLNHGDGYYIVTGVENEDAANVTTNTPIMENLIHYAVNLKNSIAVESRGKLALTWGNLKK